MNAESEPQKTKKAWGLTGYILGALLLGAALGPFLGNRAVPLALLGGLLIQFLKAIATPLLFLAVVRALARTRVEGHLVGKMTVVAALNMSLAVMIGLFVSHTFTPGRGLKFAPESADSMPAATPELSLSKLLEGIVPKDIITPFTDRSILGVLLLAILLGAALRKLLVRETTAPSAQKLLEQLDTLYEAAAIILGWVIKLVPVAVFGATVKTVGEQGFEPLAHLASYVGVGLLGLLLHVVIVYQGWIFFYSKFTLSAFWQEAKEPALVALGTNSSLATLPVTLRALENLGVSPPARALGACIGTNLNNDGIVLYEGMAAILVAQAAGVELGLGGELALALLCVISAMGVAGIPEAGFISLAIVLSSAGLPKEALPLLLTVDWIIARGRSVVNVLSDMVLSISIDPASRRPQAQEPLP